MTILEIRIPTDQYRSMPIPGQSFNGKPSKIASCFVRASDIPSDLSDWMEVNPRMPARKKDRIELSGRVARRIVKTLQERPEIFALKNQGIYILAEHAEHVTEKGGVGALKFRLTDKEQHGIVNGGHTFHAIQQVLEEEDEDGAGEANKAWVRLHILEQVDPENIIELAEGLNRSLQVDEASLHNLEGRFKPMKAALAGKQGADHISYKMGEPGEIDVQEILTTMAALNLNLFPPDDNKHPNTLFGQPAKVLTMFEEQEDGFNLMLPRLHEVLVLWERVLEECGHHSHAQPRLGLLGRKKGKDIQKRRPRPAVFAPGRMIERRISTGLLYPVFSAFRANIDEKAWESGEFKWVVPLEALLEETIDALCDVVRTAYKDTNSDPALVGKRQAAYLACYQVILLRLARMGKLSAP